MMITPHPARTCGARLPLPQGERVSLRGGARLPTLPMLRLAAKDAAEPRHFMTYVDAAVAPLRKNGQIKLYNSTAFAGMRKAGQLTAECLDMLVDEIKPGVPTERIDKLVFEFALDHGAYPATMMYRGYRRATCTSINHVVCHGIPNEKPLKEGDIVNIDVTLILDGWHGNSSRMYAVGEIPRRGRAADRCDLRGA